MNETVVTQQYPEGPPRNQHTSDSGVRVIHANGEDFFNADDIRRCIVEEINKLPQETRPAVKAAQDARQIIDELTSGIGRDIDLFRGGVKTYIEDIRASRFSIVSETAQMTTSLKDVRQFFLGSDYKEQVDRLREFVGLCERLKALKDSGFLDRMADTLLKLS